MKAGKCAMCHRALLLQLLLLLCSPAGTINPVTGAAQRSACKPCPQGTKNPVAGARMQSASALGGGRRSILRRVAVHAPQWCSMQPCACHRMLNECTGLAAAGAVTCQKCKIGTINPYEGAADCLDCQAGTFGIAEGQWLARCGSVCCTVRCCCASAQRPRHKRYWLTCTSEALPKLLQEPQARRRDAKMLPLVHMLTRWGK